MSYSLNCTFLSQISNNLVEEFVTNKETHKNSEWCTFCISYIINVCRFSIKISPQNTRFVGFSYKSIIRKPIISYQKKKQTTTPAAWMWAFKVHNNTVHVTLLSEVTFRNEKQPKDGTITLVLYYELGSKMNAVLLLSIMYLFMVSVPI